MAGKWNLFSFSSWKRQWMPVVVSSETPFMPAATMCQWFMFWLKTCLSVAKGKFGSNSLIFASENGHLEIVKYLISVGADKDAKNEDGYTPLMYASYFGKIGLVQYLISVGANKEAKDKNGYTPLICTSFNGRLEVVQYLISVGANKEAKNNDGETALMVAKGKVIYYLKTICAN
ncbi:hypothetical protein TVAG_245950 [Trichomonas vaginalis G3]|uniref:Uncharacterized protein n=1 Tax=Trichomonas vaginalis (strain ATCC PRA-98 / G3) TaxID=412133 RepID=A2E4Q3_TRIV3|nr:spectrin binding [Trichomonas vaginalis G3]EAY12363.1 hypothetical protein TVAG_245950 [Trichomonas vaginalis G3]KAI5500781.1 spectrin binding [Trichomonas vaginalis G3]|eukprot:XP_001324586.1 hypothetical protein [Trichomonas vaginalis G3]